MRDLDAAARRLEDLGLASVEGGRHPGWGTANRIVPLGTAYLELVAVVDADEAAGNVFGRWVAKVASDDPRPFGWAVRTDDLDAVARRLALSAQAGSRLTPAGDVLSWRTAGLERAAHEPCLPFFIEWGRGTRFPGSLAAPERRDRPRISRVVLRGDGDQLGEWLGEHDLPVEVTPGEPAVVGVAVALADGEIALSAES